MVDPDPQPGFKIDDYIDLSGVKDPRTLSEIRRTLEHFATKQEGRDLIIQAGTRGGHTKLHITDENTLRAEKLPSGLLEVYGTNKYYNSGHTVNISVDQIATSSYYTTPDLNPDKLAPMNLPDVLWHEMEHARDPIWEQLDSPEFKQKSAKVTAEIWDGHAKEELADYAKKYPGSVQYDANGTVVSVDGQPYADFRETVINELNERNRRELKDERYVPTANPFLERKIDWTLLGGVNDQLIEDPPIAKTNHGMEVCYPGTPPRFTHEAVSDPEHPHAVNSGTLTPEAQAKEDAKFNYKPLTPKTKDGDELPVQETKQQKDAPLKEEKKEESKTPPEPAQATPSASVEKGDHPMAKLDLSSIKLDQKLKTAEIGILDAHSAAPASTSNIKPVEIAASVA